MEMVLNMLKNRYNELSQDERIKYIHMYKNRGLFAGASLGHSHSQVVALPMVPDENRGIARYFEKTGRCLLCDMLQQEIKEQQRIVYESDNYVLICPYASRFSYETWIVPRKHTAHFGAISSEEISELGVVLQRFISAMLECLNDPSYNMVIVSSPVNTGCSSEGYHWYIELSPRLIVTAGLEIGTGYYVNPVAPEISSGILRESFIKAFSSTGTK
jgi:UDPglucose--hexose-1-phosphate uridylyltransferase